MVVAHLRYRQEFSSSLESRLNNNDPHWGFSVKLKHSVLALAGLAFSMGAFAATPKLSEQQIETIVHNYLLKNPGIIREAIVELQRQDAAQAKLTAEQAVQALGPQLFAAAESPVGGNPNGDVTVIEFFDYHCGYCKRVAPDVQALIASDPNIRLVYKELPILGPDSILAARAALAAAKQGQYQGFHDALFASASLQEPVILELAAKAGLDVARLRSDMNSAVVSAELEANINMSTPLGINGTPGFIIGNQVVPGAVDLAGLRQLVSAARLANKPKLTQQ
jgi:protein-disulfide isomerase